MPAYRKGKSDWLALIRQWFVFFFKVVVPCYGHTVPPHAIMRNPCSLPLSIRTCSLPKFLPLLAEDTNFTYLLNNLRLETAPFCDLGLLHHRCVHVPFQLLMS